MKGLETERVALKASGAKRRWVSFVLFLSFISIVFGHPRTTDPRLAELNDYLGALQVLKEKDPQAEQLFKLWQRVRTGSWEMRRLTDEKDLRIDSPAVIGQIHKTNKLRRELLKKCRKYWSDQGHSIPTVRLRIDKTIDVDWPDPVISVPVWSRKVVLIEIKNQRQADTDIELYSKLSDQILFWKKSLKARAESSRYTFVYLSPVREGPDETTIFVRLPNGHDAQFKIRVQGTPEPLRPTGLLLPSEGPSTVRLSQHDRDVRDRSSEEGFPKKSIRFRIRELETDKPLPVRVEVQDGKGKSFWTPLRGSTYAVKREQAGWETPLWRFQTGPYFYIDGDAELGVDPTGKMVRVYHGFEYEPVSMRVPDNGVVEVAPRRWINMAAKGWYSGHTHIHTTDVGMPVGFTQFWPLIAQAEDIGVSNILTLKGEWETHAIYANEYPMGVVSWASQKEHVIAYGEEYRNNPYGHLCLLGIDKLIEPISSGALGELGGSDYPPNAFVLDIALSQDAATVGAHFGLSIFDTKQIKCEWPSTGFEMPVDVALKKLQIAEIYGNGGQQEVWYKLLRCGFEIPATAGPDWDMKDTPRTYVFLGNAPLSFDRWLEGLKRGNSFITEGPMVFLKVDGQRPGARLKYFRRPQTVSIEASALVPGKSIPVEIIVNGRVEIKGTDVRRPIKLEDSCWIAARCRGAHTNPVYITLAERPRGSVKDAKEFMAVIDRLTEWVNTKGLFDSQGQKEAVLDVIQKGRSVYEAIEKRACNQEEPMHIAQ